MFHVRAWLDTCNVIDRDSQGLWYLSGSRDLLSHADDMLELGCKLEYL